MVYGRDSVTRQQMALSHVCFITPLVINVCLTAADAPSRYPSKFVRSLHNLHPLANVMYYIMGAVTRPFLSQLSAGKMADARYVLWAWVLGDWDEVDPPTPTKKRYFYRCSSYGGNERGGPAAVNLARRRRLNSHKHKHTPLCSERHPAWFGS
jgi:hypothetical protein